MKIKIGPYKNWFGPYQLAELLKYVGFKEDTTDKIGKYLSTTFVRSFLEWIHSKRHRKISVKIHDYDVWSMDSTLAFIILPMLEKIKEDKQGTPFIDDEDVPINIRNGDDYSEEKWLYILEEMIFAFKSKNTPWIEKFYSGNCEFVLKEIMSGNFELVKWPSDTFKIDFEGKKKYQDRISNGFRLFGKYYESLWT
jgi:hypothetical protein